MKTPTPHRPHLSSCTSFFCYSNIVQVQTCQVSALCFAHGRSWILLVQCCLLCGLRRQYAEETHCMSIPHSYTAQIKHSGYRDIHLPQVMGPRLQVQVQIRSTPIPMGGNLSRSMISKSLPPFPIPSGDFFNGTLEIAKMWNLLAGENPTQSTVWTRREKWKHFLESGISRIKHQNF